MTNESIGGGDDDGQMYMAHVRKGADGVWYEHLLNDHLQKVSRLAGGFAHTFGASEWAELAGLWHDLGKYSMSFTAPTGAGGHWTPSSWSSSDAASSTKTYT